jgi:hypothetical protein
MEINPLNTLKEIVESIKSEKIAKHEGNILNETFLKILNDIQSTFENKMKTQNTTAITSKQQSPQTQTNTEPTHSSQSTQTVPLTHSYQSIQTTQQNQFKVDSKLTKTKREKSAEKTKI